MPLSLDGVKGMIANLKQLAKELRDDVKVDIERDTCGVIAGLVQANIPTDDRELDGNYLGADGASVSVEPALEGHETVWRGEQIAFLEFGTGASGANVSYPRPDVMGRAGYHPDPTKAWWVYSDAKYGDVLSRGLVPQAPMYAAAVLGRGAMKEQATRVLSEAVGRAVTLR
jgi:hypothetical protein